MVVILQAFCSAAGGRGQSCGGRGASPAGGRDGGGQDSQRTVPGRTDWQVCQNSSIESESDPGSEKTNFGSGSRPSFDTDLDPGKN